jgi:site-specific recombinase XerD
VAAEVVAHLPLDRVIDAYLLACRTEGMSPNTVRWYGQKLAAFLAHLRAYGVSPVLPSVVPESVREFLVELQSLGRTTFTTRGYVQVLKGFGTWLVEEGYVGQNPLRRLQLPKVPKYVVKSLSAEEISALLGAVNPRSNRGARNLAILLLLLDTGMRLGELAGMTAAEAEDAVRDGLFKVMGKGSRERYLPLGKATRDALRRYLHVYRPLVPAKALFIGDAGRPLSAEGLRQVIRRVARRASVEGVHPHRLRHTFAVNYIANGGDAMTLQRILGHSTLEMVRRYVALDSREIMARHSQASPGDRFWVMKGLRKIA